VSNAWTISLILHMPILVYRDIFFRLDQCVMSCIVVAVVMP